MKHALTLLLLSALSGPALAQQLPQPSPYRATPDKVNNLVHTRLDARFDYANARMPGKVWITLRPHFYPTDSLRLDAKAMEIKSVSLLQGGKNLPLKYTYDGMQLDIDLNRTYTRNESYTVYIDYTARPNEFTGKGSAAINDAKGLYFIDPKDEVPGKPTQIWTQGETEATSVYVPTIDRPNQKTTQEFNLTVPDKYVSLSNGKLVASKKNADGTRTDSWKMDLPHAPYLFFIGIGPYSVVKDTYKGKEVSYYVEPEYAPVARRIFGTTPEMMAYFSRITGVEFPWSKYAQMTARDYVSGAMENTTATLHSDAAQQDARELVDGNRWEDVIAHELFHQWFGDLVTTESWSNLTVNESFANYSEYLWREYKWGKDAADAHNYDDMQGYLGSGSAAKDLVRFDYADKEDMFDAVSYNKGGRILHMLRRQVGDSAFFRSLNKYLTDNRFKSAEAHQLRLAFEEVTGRDLNPFFNQWYFNSGHPVLDINYNWDAAAKQVRVTVAQTQEGGTFSLPVHIDVHTGGDVVRYPVTVSRIRDTFLFSSAVQPSLVNFDSDKSLLAEKKENKTLDQYLFQFQHARNFQDRREALEAAVTRQAEAKAVEIMLLGLKDTFAGIRQYTVQNLDLEKEALRTIAEQELYKMAQTDKNKPVQAAAISRLAEYRFAKYIPLFTAALKDSSYSVAGSALEALAVVDSSAALREAKALDGKSAKGKLGEVLPVVFIRFGDLSYGEQVLSRFESMAAGQAKFDMLQPLTLYLQRESKEAPFKRGVDAIHSFLQAIPEAYRPQLTPYFDQIFQSLQQAKTAAGQKALATYAAGKMTTKGF